MGRLSHLHFLQPAGDSPWATNGVYVHDASNNQDILQVLPAASTFLNEDEWLDLTYGFGPAGSAAHAEFAANTSQMYFRFGGAQWYPPTQVAYDDVSFRQLFPEIPEPGTIATLAVGLGVLGAARSRRKTKSA